ncbi:hypothetical protein BZA05DRAFT_266006 [Tricharina praecox]|uniref:uncharacterized protein n=1 Tax=Tricharina praecox TaxID=43433 RepID=UPI00221EACB9|nr:uncharacterized protein BZA05DRAFT_266006 [Tricharina praecox]KAI5854442.1 hypothetical protein BZA05DRAFT_266006 [Tricharina praecox]
MKGFEWPHSMTLVRRCRWRARWRLYDGACAAMRPCPSSLLFLPSFSRVPRFTILILIVLFFAISLIQSLPSSPTTDSKRRSINVNSFTFFHRLFPLTAQTVRVTSNSQSPHPASKCTFQLRVPFPLLIPPQTTTNIHPISIPDDSSRSLRSKITNGTSDNSNAGYKTHTTTQQRIYSSSVPFIQPAASQRP